MIMKLNKNTNICWIIVLIMTQFKWSKTKNLIQLILFKFLIDGYSIKNQTREKTRLVKAKILKM